MPSNRQVRKKGGHLSFAQEPRDRPRTPLIPFRIQICISEFLPYILHTKVSTCNCAYGRWLQNMWFLMDSCDSATQSQPQVATTNAGNCDYSYHYLSLSLSLHVWAVPRQRLLFEIDSSGRILCFCFCFPFSCVCMLRMSSRDLAWAAWKRVQFLVGS